MFALLQLFVIIVLVLSKVCILAPSSWRQCCMFCWALIQMIFWVTGMCCTCCTEKKYN